MSKLKKNKCVCSVCFRQFRSKDKFKKLCKEHNKNEKKD